MIEINGHWIDENEVSYISPIRKSTGGYWISETENYDWCSFNFGIIVDTEFVLLEFKEEEAAKEAHSKCVTICCNVVR